MRRVIAPVLLAVFLFAGNSANAGFGLFHHNADSCCDSCGTVEPVCGCEPVDPCCEPAPKCGGLLHRLFKHRGNDSCCGVSDCYVEPSCGYEVAAPCNSCEVAAPCCEEAAPCCGSGQKRGGLLHRLFHHRNDSCCDAQPCGCESAYEPSCGCGF